MVKTHSDFHSFSACLPVQTLQVLRTQKTRAWYLEAGTVRTTRGIWVGFSI